MDRRPVPTGQHLRDLLRSGRRASGNITQRAAAQRAGISSVYWQKIESGTHPDAPAGTLAAMLAALGITPGQLRNCRYPVQVTDALRELYAARAAEQTPEEHLAATPGATAEEISALQAVWRALKAGRTTEPFGQELRNTRRNDTQQ